jgi:hypothetical protein
MVIPYDQLSGVHSLIAILTKAVKYKANHGAKFVRPARLPLYDKLITDNAMTVIHVCAEAAHKSQLNDYANYKAAEQGLSKFLCNVVNEIRYNDLKNTNTFYTKVMAIDIMSLLHANSGGLHTLNMISLCTDMMQYHMQADGIPQFIVVMEEAQKKAKRAGMPIANIKLIMMALAAVLAAQHFPHEFNDWEGFPGATCMWQAWKVAFRLAHLKHQRQLQALGGGKPHGGAHAMIPTFAPTIDPISKVLENLALAALNDTTVLQQLTAAKLVLTALVASLTAANKKLADTLVRNKGIVAPATMATPAVAPAPPKACLATRFFPGNYCWTHGHRVNQTHTSATSTCRAPGHKRTGQLPTQWAVAKQTRDETPAPDGVGVPI